MKECFSAWVHCSGLAGGNSSLLRLLFVTLFLAPAPVPGGFYLKLWKGFEDSAPNLTGRPPLGNMWERLRKPPNLAGSSRAWELGLSTFALFF